MLGLNGKRVVVTGASEWLADPLTYAASPTAFAPIPPSFHPTCE